MERMDFEGYFFIRDESSGEWIMVLKGPWRDEYHRVISNQNISALRLSYSAGWKEPDISFVRKLKGIRSLEVYNWGVTDISPFAEITDLEEIGLECNFKNPIDFSQFPQLRICFLKWRPKSESLFNATSIQTLNIVNYPYENLTPLHKLRKLQDLKLTSNKIRSLAGASRLSNLITLDLFRCSHLATLEGIQDAVNLAILELDSCKKVKNVRPLAAIKKLRRVVLNNCGTLESLLPLRGCPRLEELLLTEDTNIEDGSIYIFRELPTLRNMWFANRRHYSDTHEQVQQAISSRQQ